MATKLLDWRVGTGQTTSNGTVDLITYAVPANSNASVKVRVQLYNTTPAGGALELNGSFTRTSGNVAADNTTVSVGSILAVALATASVAIVVSGSSVIVRATGVAATTIEWMAEAKINVYTP